MKLSINPEFRDLIPPLEFEEFKELESSIKKDGCLDAIKVWNNTIIDGHNRYRICTDNHIDFDVMEMELDSEDDAKIWIIKNQFGRRNINAATRAMLALELEPLIREKARENQLRKPESVLQNSVKQTKPVNTQKEVAKIAGISHSTIYEAKKVKESDNEEVKRQMVAGKISIHKAYMEVMPKPSENELRTCKYCGITKKATLFHNNTQCKDCRAARAKYGVNPAALLNPITANAESVLLDMATKKPAGDKSNSNDIVTELLDILKNFRTHINKYLYMKSVLEGLDSGCNLAEEIEKAKSELQAISNYVKGEKQ
jgi:ParB-like chromosome segregation protein Spo0J